MVLRAHRFMLMTFAMMAQMPQLLNIFHLHAMGIHTTLIPILMIMLSLLLKAKQVYQKVEMDLDNTKTISIVVRIYLTLMRRAVVPFRMTNQEKHIRLIALIPVLIILTRKLMNTWKVFIVPISVDVSSRLRKIRFLTIPMQPRKSMLNLKKSIWHVKVLGEVFVDITRAKIELGNLMVEKVLVVEIVDLDQRIATTTCDGIQRNVVREDAVIDNLVEDGVTLEVESMGESDNDPELSSLLVLGHVEILLNLVRVQIGQGR